MAAVHIVMVIGEYGCKRDLWNKGQRKVNIEHPQCRCMDKTQATAFHYLRFILLKGESLYAGVFFITFFRTVRSCSDNFSCLSYTMSCNRTEKMK